MVNKYSYNNLDKETMAWASSQNVAISLKKSVEVAKFIKGKKADKACSLLEKVIEEKQVVPYTRYFAEMGHKRGKGISTGGYPVKVAKEFLRVLKGAIKNAEEKELGEDLRVLSCSVRKGSRRYHNGRFFGRLMKSTNLEIVVEVCKK